MTARLRRALLGTPRPLIALLVPILLVGATAFILLRPRAAGPDDPSPTPSASGAPTPSTEASPLVFDGPPYDVTVVQRPTRDAGQAKLWFHADTWWGILFDPAMGQFAVHRLDPSAPAWLSTGVAVDPRDDARIDVLAVDDRVLVVAAGPSVSSAGDALRLHELRFDAELGLYQPAADVPLALSGVGGRSLGIAREPDGRLWLTILRDGRPVLLTAADEARRWTLVDPFPIAAASEPVDEAALVGLEGGIALVLTSSQRPAVIVARHEAGAPPDRWRETTIRDDGLGAVPGRLDAAAIPGPGGERLLLTVGTALPGVRNPESPDVVLLVVEPSGSWASHLVARRSDGLDRPILAVDPAADRLFVVASAPTRVGRAIIVKESSLSDVSFSAGVGVPLIQGTGLGELDDVATTKQLVDAGTGLVVIASDDITGMYATAAMPLGGPIPGSAWEPPSVPLPLLRDGFDAWTPEDPVLLDWEVAGGTPNGRLSLVAAGDGTALRLSSATPERARACRAVPATRAEPLAVEAVVRVARYGGSDAAFAIRGGGDDSAVIRFDDVGTLAYFRGAEKVDTTAAFAEGTWYRLRIQVDAGRRTYDASVTRLGAEQPLLQVTRVPWRSPTGGEVVDEICLEVPAGAGTAIDIDVLNVEG